MEQCSFIWKQTGFNIFHPNKIFLSVAKSNYSLPFFTLNSFLIFLLLTKWSWRTNEFLIVWIVEVTRMNPLSRSLDTQKVSLYFKHYKICTRGCLFTQRSIMKPFWNDLLPPSKVKTSYCCTARKGTLHGGSLKPLMNNLFGK